MQHGGDALSSPTRPNYIAGTWRSADATNRNVNPSDLSDTIGLFAVGGSEDVADAIAAGREAFPGWSRTSPLVRAEILMRIGDEIIARQTELGELLSREEGKTRPEGIAEAVRAGQIFRFFAAEPVRNGGELLESLREGVNVEITREPLGVIGLITPWNFPLAIPAWKLAPALAFGNCVILKPADLVPASAWAVAEIASRAGLPAGVFNLVMGPGSTVGDAIAGAEGLDGVSFTGSVGVGRRIIRRCAENFTRCQLEMGGKNPLVILADADLDLAVDCALQGAFGSSGQRCTASSRLVVERGIADAFTEQLTSRMRSWKVGPALDPATQMGPLVDGDQLQTVMDYIRIGQEEGATLGFGGQRPKDLSVDGYYIEPTLFTNTKPEMRINREEIFGPVATIQLAADYDEALALANDTEFGLCAGVVTNSLKRATHFKRNAEVGVVTVNAPTAGLDFHVAFGGRKGSSHGPREQGRYAREFFTTIKTAYTKAA